MLALIVLCALVGLIILGVPIAIALGMTAVGTYLALGEPAILTMLPQRMYKMSYSLSSTPSQSMTCATLPAASRSNWPA